MFILNGALGEALFGHAKNITRRRWRWLRPEPADFDRSMKIQKRGVVPAGSRQTDDCCSRCCRGNVRRRGVNTVRNYRRYRWPAPMSRSTGISGNSPEIWLPFYSSVATHPAAHSHWTALYGRIALWFYNTHWYESRYPYCARDNVIYRKLIS